MAYNACMSNCKDPENRSKRKTCVCGGHNHNNPKKNLSNHATFMKWTIKKTRRGLEKISSINLDDKYAQVINSNFWELL